MSRATSISFRWAQSFEELKTVLFLQIWSSQHQTCGSRNNSKPTYSFLPSPKHSLLISETLLIFVKSLNLANRSHLWWNLTFSLCLLRCEFPPIESSESPLSEFNQRGSSTYQPPPCIALYSHEGQFRLTEGSGEILEGGVAQVYNKFRALGVTILSPFV